MIRAVLFVLFLFVLAIEASAQTAPARTPTPKSFGAVLTSVPEALYAQVPKLTAGQGVIIKYVVSDSPAARAGLQNGVHLTRLVETPFPMRREE
jgi:S1-C subfamily serine protease